MAKYIPTHTGAASSTDRGGGAEEPSMLVATTTGNGPRGFDNRLNTKMTAENGVAIELNDTPVEELTREHPEVTRSEVVPRDNNVEEMTERAPIQADGPEGRPPKRKGPPLVTDVELECLKWRAERYRDWESWEVATGSSASSWRTRQRDLMRVVIRGATQTTWPHAVYLAACWPHGYGDVEHGDPCGRDGRVAE